MRRAHAMEPDVPIPEPLLADLDTSHRALIEACAVLTDEALAASGSDGRTLADRLYEVGARDDWARRAIGQAIEGRPVAGWRSPKRPGYLATSRLLAEWLAQARRALLARVRGVEDADAPFETDDGVTWTPAALLRYLDAQQRAEAASLR